jgi:hypothetical protein
MPPLAVVAPPIPVSPPLPAGAPPAPTVVLIVVEVVDPAAPLDVMPVVLVGFVVVLPVVVVWPPLVVPPPAPVGDVVSSAMQPLLRAKCRGTRMAVAKRTRFMGNPPEVRNFQKADKRMLSSQRGALAFGTTMDLRPHLESLRRSKCETR